MNDPQGAPAAVGEKSRTVSVQPSWHPVYGKLEAYPTYGKLEAWKLTPRTVRRLGKDQLSAETCARLLRAATEVFAEEGYRNATLREICRRASANIAAVNYHFRDKERLYLAVIEQATEVAAKGIPAVESLAGSRPEEKLGGFIRSVLENLLGAGRPTLVLKLIWHEMVEPTAALDVMIQRIVRPVSEGLRAIVAELLGPGADPVRIRDCAASITSQCVSFDHSAAVVERLHGENVHDEAVIERLAEHVTAFSLGGIAALAASGGSPRKPRASVLEVERA